MFILKLYTKKETLKVSFLFLYSGLECKTNRGTKSNSNY